MNYAMLKSVSNKTITFKIVAEDNVPTYFHKTNKKHGNIQVYATKSFLAAYPQ